MAQEEDFIGLVVAHARISTWTEHIKDAKHPTRQLQAMAELAAAIEADDVMAEEASRANLAPHLTAMLAHARDDAALDAISRLLAALAGAAAQRERLQEVRYPRIGKMRIKEGLLGDGVGARLWGISHRFNLLLVEHPELVRGARVLELGSGVGSSGITAAKLGAEQVVLTDFVAQVLALLAESALLNSTRAGERAAAAQASGGDGEPPPSEAHAALDSEADFENAESVSDFDELFADDGDAASGGGGEGCAGVGPGCTGEVLDWEVDNMVVRFLDWKEDYDRLKAAAVAKVGSHNVYRTICGCAAHLAAEDDTSSALTHVTLASSPRATPVPSARDPDTRLVSALSDSEAALLASSPVESSYATFDKPTGVGAAELPPGLEPGDRFPVVLGCEVMYELLHAKWVVGVLKVRLAPGGKALIIGAIRDRSVFDAFERYLGERGFEYASEKVSPVPGYSGLGSKEDIYDGGYVLYYIQHKAAPCLSWHDAAKQLRFA